MLIKEIEDYVKSVLSTERFIHTKRVVSDTVILCRMHKQDEKKGEYAGLLHDLARELPGGEIIRIVQEDQAYQIREWEREFPILLHGKAAAILSEKLFSINDKEILEAIELHTLGRPSMTELSKILFVADYIEEGRDHITKAYRDKLMSLPLDNKVYKVLVDLVDYMKNRGMFMAPPTWELYEQLKIKTGEYMENNLYGA